MRLLFTTPSESLWYAYVIMYVTSINENVNHLKNASLFHAVAS